MRDLSREALHQLADLVADWLEERPSPTAANDAPAAPGRPRTYPMTEVDKARLRRELGAAGWPKRKR